MAARFTARQIPHGRTAGSLQRVAETFISHWFYMGFFNFPLGEVENDGFPLVLQGFCVILALPWVSRWTSLF